MEKKDTKTSLKEAREALKKQDYKTAQKLCKSVLEKDRNNYTALVLFGAALLDSDQRNQAVNAFKKAIEVSPEKPLAWRGLSQYYEKVSVEGGDEELVRIYKKILSLESEGKETVEISKKLAQVALKLNDLDLCVDTLTSLQKSTAFDKEEEKSVKNLIVSTLSQVKDIPSKYVLLLKENIAGLLDSSTTIENDENFRKYLKLLYKYKEYDKLLLEAKRMHDIFNECKYPLEWICRVYYESLLDEQDVSISCNEVENYTTKLLSMNPESSMGLVAKGAMFYKRKKYVDSCDILKQALPLLPNSYYVLGIIGMSYLSLGNVEDAAFFFKESLKKFKSSSVDGSIRKLKLFLIQYLAKALSLHSDKNAVKEAVPLCTELLVENKENILANLTLARAYIELGNIKEASELIKKVKSTGQVEMEASIVESLLLKHEGKLTEAYQILSSSANHQNSTSEIWTELGKLQWELGDFDESLVSFLKAAKLDPCACTPFVFLGRLYNNVSEDKDKARRCYQKAFQLNPHSVEAGKGLSDAYRAQGYLDANLELLMSVTSTAAAGTSAKWAWLRLGLHHLEEDNPNEAIKCLQSAIRSDPMDRHCWESLADAYLARGSYLTALKSYLRVTELDPSAVYPAFQIASIKQVLGNYEESLEDFQNLLESNAGYLPALKGIGETYLSLARVYLSQQLNGLARDMCEKAIFNLTKAAKQCDFACIWKLMGDSCTLLAKLPDSLAHLEVHPQLINAEASDCDNVSITKLEVLELGARCYCRALNLMPDNCLLWHDLALNYNCQANCVTKRRIRRNLCTLAVDAAKKSVSLSPGNTNHWNLLGVLCASNEIRNYKLSQHSFCMSIRAEEINEVAWTNLGTLYLCLGEIRLAHAAFSKAQSIQPSYPGCWIGQALIAESVDSSGTMDLFRHTTQLGIHPESCLGYAHWVCTTLDLAKQNKEFQKNPNYIYSIVKMHAIPSATDCLIWYTGRIHNEPSAYNMLGLLLERQKLYEGAREAFRKALSLMEYSDEHKVLDIIRNNYARVLVCVGKFSEATEQYLAIKDPDYVTQCGLAQAYLKGEKHEESYAAYEAALNWMVELPDVWKSHILVAMAAVAYKVHPEITQTLLFQSFQSESPSIRGIFAMCAFGILTQDVDLTEQMLKKLAPFKDNEVYISDIATFHAYTYFTQGQYLKSLRHLSGRIHCYPNVPTLWLSLALLLLHTHRAEPREEVLSVATCAQVALSIGQSMMNVSKIMSFVSLGHLLSGKTKDSLRSAQKAVHLFPDVPENWIVLIASYLPQCIGLQSSNGTSWLKLIISHVRRRLEASRPMMRWLSNYERMVTQLYEEYAKKTYQVL